MSEYCNKDNQNTTEDEGKNKNEEKKSFEGKSGRHEWTRTTDPHHVKVTALN